MARSTPATQNFVEIKEIRNGVVHLKNGGVRKILIVGGKNLDLLSEEEQEVMMNGFQSFLNGLDFSVQFFIHSRKINIDSYLEKIKARESDEPNELLKIQIGEYVEFVRSFVEQNPIITKSFFVVVPYSPTATMGGATKGLLGFFKKPVKETVKGDENLEKTVEQLTYRVSRVTEGLEQIGLRVSPLNDEELAELFYNLYNPELVEKKGVEIPGTKSNTN